MGKDIVMVLNYAPVPKVNIENDRVLTIINSLVKQGDNVELITSDFAHASKKKKDITEEEIAALPYKYTMLHEPPYPKNVCIKRFYAHSKLAKNIAKYLKDRKKPDLVFTVTTSTAVGYAAAKYAKKNDIPLVIDVQDLWPEAFKMAVKPAILADIIFFREKQKANYIYRSADGIVAVSDEYVNRALRENKKVKHGVSVYLGTSIEKFDSIAKESRIVKPDGEIWVAYIGTLGTSYNIKCIIDAFAILKNKGLTNIKFKVMGSGPLMQSFEDYATEKNVECEFIGRLPYEDMVKYLVKCDIAVNPIIDKSAASIINKVADYAVAGLPVINTMISKEYRDLLTKYNAGFSYSNADSDGIAKCIEMLSNDEKLRKEMGANNRRAGEELFDRDRCYHKITDVINTCVNR